MSEKEIENQEVRCLGGRESNEKRKDCKSVGTTELSRILRAGISIGQKEWITFIRKRLKVERILRKIENP